jgi:lipopolysaccharide transport system permease protein
MYASPIIYPLSILPSEYRIFIIANPITPIIVGFRQAFISAGVIEINMLISSVILTIVIFLSGLLVFNKVEKNFIDTV